MGTRNPENERPNRKPAHSLQSVGVPYRSFESTTGPRRVDGTIAMENSPPASPREQSVYLDKIACDVIPKIEMPESELKDRENLRLSLLKVCMQVVKDAAASGNRSTTTIHVSLNCFGSLRAGIALQGSDLDLLLKVTDENNRDLVWELDIPRHLEKRLLIMGYGAKLLTTPRVPVLKTCSQPGKELRDSLLEELEWAQSSRENLPDPSITVPSLRRPDARLFSLFNIAMRDGYFNPEERNIILKFQDCYRKAHGVSTNPELCAARSSLTKLPTVLDRYPDHPPSDMAGFPTNGVGIKCDMGFSGDLARHNSQLIRCYTHCDERLRHMIIFVKAWAKNRDINTPFQGTLCSYGYVLMALHFAINIASPPLCPNLQHQLGPMRGGADDVPKECSGYNVQFWRDEKQVELAAVRGMLTYNEESLGSLLRGFFCYYGELVLNRKCFNWGANVISIRSKDGLIAKTEKKWTSRQSTVVPSAFPEQPPRIVWSNHLLAIEDPFEIDHNVARTVSRLGLEAIKDEFRRAHRLIQNAGHLGGTAAKLMEVGEPKMRFLNNRLPQSKPVVGTKPTGGAFNQDQVPSNALPKNASRRELETRFSGMKVE